jgi:hypothetical protein
MKQSEIITGYEHYVKTKPSEQNDYEWPGLNSYKFPDDSEVVCVVLAKGIEQNRRKDRIEVRAANTEYYGDGTYLVPARHIVESVKGREERLAQEAYVKQWVEALRENELRDKADSFDKAGLGDLIEDREEDAARDASKLLRELRDLKTSVDNQINKFVEAAEDDAKYRFKLKDGAEYPLTGIYGGIQNVIAEARNVENALFAYNRSAPLVNQLRKLAKPEGEPTTELE